jgi:hypothetical protein
MLVGWLWITPVSLCHVFFLTARANLAQVGEPNQLTWLNEDFLGSASKLA